MEILPLLIFIGGIIYTAIASQKDKGNKEERNIDPSKMDRPTGSAAPRRRQSGSENQSKGLFDDMVGEIERRFSGETEQTPKNTRQPAQEASPSRPASQRAERQSNQRPMSERSFGRSLEEKAKETNAGKKAADPYRQKTRGASQGYDWADRAREEVKNRQQGRGQKDEVETVASGERPRRQQKPAEPAPKPKIQKESLSFGRKDIVNGVIFSEIIGKPRSRR
ncbi:hypothetical protein [Salinicoccus roseus]|jgi:hypothetical protein|uniref:Uncharacterized protein n=1 Tax=Salinicoccus roseus TaxID=45670 RepID=A0A0C2HDT4_9STAP|nr:hypothetical protein [Salinicoccus roseus]KIH71800.1 hypothetical protein SN16_00075 [Salinicoccus roseus]MDB0578930.1 hypothetical protein [Salinicoccus roseus]OZT78186.1 hypothetical protein CFN03_02575 [Salinicoccus roseus]